MLPLEKPAIKLTEAERIELVTLLAELLVDAMTEGEDEYLQRNED